MFVAPSPLMETAGDVMVPLPLLLVPVMRPLKVPSALPLMLSTGVGAELRRPLGIGMVGGLMLSQVLTLFTTPVIYLLFDRLSLHLKRRFPRQEEEA